MHTLKYSSTTIISYFSSSSYSMHSCMHTTTVCIASTTTRGVCILGSTIVLLSSSTLVAGMHNMHRVCITVVRQP